MSEYLTKLPPEILSEIFSRLPIKSILACRCLCKTFLDITSSNPYFNSLHSSKTVQYLILQLGSIHNLSRSVHMVESELDTAFASGRKDVLKVMFQIPKFPERYFERYHVHVGRPNSFVLVNSYDGLLYFAERDAYERSFVCNPVTNEYLVLPEYDIEKNRFQLTMGSWFGFSQGENRYKVLRIFSTLKGRPWEINFKQDFWAQVHVVGSSLWRDIKDRPPSEYISWDTCFTLLNGTIYWLSRYPQLSKFINYFDFHQEKFGDILPPLEFGTGWQINQHCMSLGVLRGCLSVTVNTESLDIWVMEKHEGRVTWTKQFVINTSSLHISRHLTEGPFKPMQIMSNRRILMMIRADLIVGCYDVKENTFRFFKLNGVRSVSRSVLFKPNFARLKEALMVDNVIVQNIW